MTGVNAGQYFVSQNRPLEKSDKVESAAALISQESNLLSRFTAEQDP